MGRGRVHKAPALSDDPQTVAGREVEFLVGICVSSRLPLKQITPHPCSCRQPLVKCSRSKKKKAMNVGGRLGQKKRFGGLERE